MLILGDRDEEAKIVSVRDRSTGETAQMTVDELIASLNKEIAEKTMK